MSDTPRTDVTIAVKGWRCVNCKFRYESLVSECDCRVGVPFEFTIDDFVEADFARDLERENTRLREQMNTKYWDAIREDNIALNEQLKRLRSDLAKLRSVAEAARELRTCHLELHLSSGANPSQEFHEAWRKLGDAICASPLPARERRTRE